MQDVIRHRTAFQERVIYTRTGRVVLRQFENANSIIPYDIIVVAEGNQGTVPAITKLDSDTAVVKPRFNLNKGGLCA